MNYGINKKTIKLLYSELLEKKIIKKIWVSRQFPDDPRIHNYGAVLHNSKKFSDGISYQAEAFGFSFKSKEKALFKCLTETVERFSQNCYRQSQIIYSSFNQLKEPALDPFLYIADKAVRSKKLGWVKGKNITKNYDCLIPAQLVYLTYRRDLDEVLLQDINTTGSAGGFDYESTLLRAIYEVVERDAIMNTFLGKFPAKRIELHPLINMRSVKEFFSDIERYKLEMFVFDITTNIGIPSFLSILLDRTGLGPAFGFGTKTSFNKTEAIAGCIEESLQTRPWLRIDLLKQKNRLPKIDPTKIKTIRERGMFWSSLSHIRNLSFLLDQPAQSISNDESFINEKQALKKAIEILAKEKYELYWADVTVPNLLSFPYFVHKAIIPGTQYLPLDESLKRTNISRLKEVAKFYQVPVNTPNPLPQPML